MQTIADSHLIPSKAMNNYYRNLGIQNTCTSLCWTLCHSFLMHAAGSVRLACFKNLEKKIYIATKQKWRLAGGWNPCIKQQIIHFRNEHLWKKRRCGNRIWKKTIKHKTIKTFCTFRTLSSKYQKINKTKMNTFIVKLKNPFFCIYSTYYITYFDFLSSLLLLLFVCFVERNKWIEKNV